MAKIRVKIIARGQDSYPWRHQIPGKAATWNHCLFLFNKDEKDYDWLVVIDDISRSYWTSSEQLACADEHTLLVTSEPPTITRYGTKFVDQFAHVLTSHPNEALPHKQRIYSQTGNLWFNGHSFDELVSRDPPKKDGQFSTVCSNKQQKHTIHNDRYQFTQWLCNRIPKLDLYGHGTRFIQHKYNALDPYKFHLAIENYIGPHHWTEKLSDPYLSLAIPIYYGCPNMADYFPRDSYVPIDINEPEEALDTISSVLSDPNAYTKRLDALQEAKHRVLHQYNLIAMLDELISEKFDPKLKASKRPLYGRKQMRFRHPGDLMSHIRWSLQKSLR